MKKTLHCCGILAILCFFSCMFSFEDENNTSGTSILPRIILDNSTNPFSVSVYNSFDRILENKIADVGGKQRSGERDFFPSPLGFVFYLRYFFEVENMEFFIDPPNSEIELIIPDSGTTTVLIEPLSSLVQTSKPLVNDVFFHIRNDGTSLIRLARGPDVIDGENGQVGINPDKTALFIVSPGNSSSYRIMLGANNFPFPSDLTLKQGHIYFLEFNGSDVTFIRETAITLQNAMYTVSFNANGGEGDAPAYQMIDRGSSITLPDGSGLSKEEYAFGGWNTSPDGTGTNYNEGFSFEPSENITLYARWLAVFTVEFDANGGGGTAPASQMANEGSSTTLPGGSDLSKEEYVFGGWNTSPDGTGTNYNEGFSFKPSENITLYARWLAVFTVEFDANGGSGTAPASQMANEVSSITLPDGGGLSILWFNFGGWNTKADGTGTNYNAGESFKPAEDITLYARWTAASTLAERLAWLKSNAQSGTSYLIEISGNESIAPSTLSYSGRNNISITLKGTGSQRTIGLSSNGFMFRVGSGVTLGLDSNITLKGRIGNTVSLVIVDSGGTLDMNTGSMITGNECDNAGSGVRVDNGGTFTMNGGEITGNKVAMNGGGVCVHGIFNMHGGTISGNNASGSSGGVHVGSSGTFYMYGGIISGNSSNNGSGVMIWNGGAFNMHGGTISGNGTSGAGGGVFIISNATFNMHSGTISSNNASGVGGGGVFVQDDGIFNMHNGIISSNSVTNCGGGVFVNSRGALYIQNGTIYGGSDRTRRNTAANDGAAIYNNSGTVRRGRFTAGVFSSLGSLPAGASNNNVIVANGVLQ